jgi:1-phosphofructokinase family hexose kinase
MILTTTLNSALDRVLFIDEFRPGATMRPHKVVESVGGKGFDVCVALQTLGLPNLALGFVAGTTGRQLVKLLERYQIQHDLTWVEGETRIAHVIVETRHHRTSHLIAASLTITNSHYQDLVDKFQRHLPAAVWVVCGGTAPVGVPVTVYRHFTQLAHQAGKSILIDSAGSLVLEVLAVRPDILKMNQDEFAQTFNLAAANLSELSAQAQNVREQVQLPALVITCGATGILACTPHGTYLARSPAQAVVNSAGAGDAASAALVWRLSQGDLWPEALRWAAATGAAVVITEGTADCCIADIERILTQTEVMAC